MSEEIIDKIILVFPQMILIDTERCDGSWKYVGEYQENVRHKRFNVFFSLFLACCNLSLSLVGQSLGGGDSGIKM